jgi:hypothetical protein
VAGGDSDSDSPSDLSPTTRNSLCFMSFMFSPPPPSENAQGTLYIVGFRSKQREPRENGRHPMHGSRTSTGGAICLVGIFIFGSLGPRGSTLATFVCIEII